SLLPAMLALIPRRFAEHRQEIRTKGVVLPGARDSLKAVRELPETVSSVVTGNLRPNAELKLAAFGLSRYLDLDVGGYASDDPDRPALVRLAQRRAGARHAVEFTRARTVIVGDSLEDVTTGQRGGAQVIGVCSGTADAEVLLEAGADLVLPDLRAPEALVEAIHRLTA
ncbi:MAG: haloacid dehalogenase-like hydrolase, partial [Myxococcales bacterium]